MILALFGLHFDGSIDATGVATVLLALTTAGLAWYTRVAVGQSAVELAQSQRPVLVPLRGGRSKPHLDGTEYVLPVVNVGLGPAMDIKVLLKFGTETGAPTAAPAAPLRTTRTAVGPNEQAYINFSEAGLNSEMGFTFSLDFADLSGSTWRTTGTYSHEDERFAGVKVERMA